MCKCIKIVNRLTKFIRLIYDSVEQIMKIAHGAIFRGVV